MLLDNNKSVIYNFTIMTYDSTVVRITRLDLKSLDTIPVYELVLIMLAKMKVWRIWIFFIGVNAKYEEYEG